MAPLSDDVNIESIQSQVAERLGTQLNEKIVDTRASRLRERLKHAKNMLLILDDLWDELDLGKVGIPMDAFIENEARELFKRIAYLSFNSSGPDLISIATEIVRKSGGLPIAIVTIAKALRNKDVNKWKDALACLKNPLRRSITGIKESRNLAHHQTKQTRTNNEEEETERVFPARRREDQRFSSHYSTVMTAEDQHVVEIGEGS
ncbi:probable disease resistance protein At1g52660 [Prosopis cineraria]|uniref:probable disease resistance protein At1g52660 n=1 Tax=Prosopis cineraria TaxID=364024 RepID=UPI0024105334|nr:probable disease resistance protein At1g52660 [Prosopis cineraria]